MKTPGVINLFNKMCCKWSQRKGWNYVQNMPADVKKAVVVVAPHTTNFDFVLSMGFVHFWGRRVNYMAKKELFKGPMGTFLRASGAISIERNKNTNVVQQMAKQFTERDELLLIIAAEGTRKAVKKWKTGFYHIAQEAGVPLWLGVLDAGNKLGGVIKELPLEGKTKEQVMVEVQAFFSDVEALDPKGWNPTFL